MHVGLRVGSGFLMIYFVPIPEDVHTHFHCKYTIWIAACLACIYKEMCHDQTMACVAWSSISCGTPGPVVDIMLHQYLMTFDKYPVPSPNISKSFGQASYLDLISSHLARTRLTWAALRWEAVGPRGIPRDGLKMQHDT